MKPNTRPSLEEQRPFDPDKVKTTKRKWGWDVCDHSQFIKTYLSFALMGRMGPIMRRGLLFLTIKHQFAQILFCLRC